MRFGKASVVLVLVLVAALVVPLGCGGPSPEQVEQSEEAKAALKKELEVIDSGNDAAAKAARGRR